jgi:hypothetical protein
VGPIHPLSPVIDTGMTNWSQRKSKDSRTCQCKGSLQSSLRCHGLSHLSRYRLGMYRCTSITHLCEYKHRPKNHFRRQSTIQHFPSYVCCLKFASYENSGRHRTEVTSNCGDSTIGLIRYLAWVSANRRYRIVCFQPER